MLRLVQLFLTAECHDAEARRLRIKERCTYKISLNHQTTFILYFNYNHKIILQPFSNVFK